MIAKSSGKKESLDQVASVSSGDTEATVELGWGRGPHSSL